MDTIEELKVEKAQIEDNKSRELMDHTAEEKCRAVLSVWTEKRKPGEICRELGVAWTVLSQWQARAMEGMILALQPRKGVALSPRLAVLLKRRSKGGAMKGLERRLARLQAKRRPGKPRESHEIGA